MSPRPFFQAAFAGYLGRGGMQVEERVKVRKKIEFSECIEVKGWCARRSERPRRQPRTQYFA